MRDPEVAPAQPQPEGEWRQWHLVEWMPQYRHLDPGWWTICACGEQASVQMRWDKEARHWPEGHDETVLRLDTDETLAATLIAGHEATRRLKAVIPVIEALQGQDPSTHLSELTVDAPKDGHSRQWLVTYIDALKEQPHD